ncbi:component of glycosylphosphatidylinositol-mannosyltransferase, putative [Candida dubliniensis CD36]|uniref:Protein PBN1 n=1 Tax=Candida dubliniensis (strain CD36 / ATCC MYA-646 / CBS 7987 / NCPF 3949 / NRRL Y-17841) TaxID=573826 RepID=B9WIL1_CANDC|nr:component of glycosylphosphatidylinositol-mannosyltransferase, putative [Candida dubliniensis CD36]CAX41076.1 component of glycosylphosphatidylinositol-mannosyltransferase, putative [Candida dubliniensis CD36]
MRQRTTIYNPYSSHDGIIINLNRTNFQLSSIPNYPFIIENKYTIKQSQESYENKLYSTIKQLRIQTKFINKSGSPIFSFNYQSGLNIYVVPYFNVDKLKFWKQVEQLIEKLLNIKIDQKNWIQNGNSFYYYDIQPIELKEINFNLNSYSNSNSNLNLNSNSNYDYIYDEDKIIIRELLTDIEKIEFNLDNSGIYKEIGLFLIDKKITTTNDDLNLSGLRVIFDGSNNTEGNDNNDNNKEEQEVVQESIHKTMFHIKPRHRILSSSESNSKIISQGLHHILNTKINISLPIDDDIDNIKECKFYYYLNLNKSLIFDQFQDIPIGSKLIINNGNKNLELPEYKINQWGNELLFEFNNSILYNDNLEINLTIHSRYQLPKNGNNNDYQFSKIFNSLPKLFIGCNINKESNLLDKSPFDTKRDIKIGDNYEIYFTENTVFYHLQQDINTNTNKLLEINIPHGKTTFDRINNITTFGLLIGILMILYGILTKIFTIKKLKRD